MVEITSFSSYLEAFGVFAVLIFVLTSIGMGFSPTYSQATINSWNIAKSLFY